MPLLIPLAGILVALMALLLIYGLDQLGRVLAHIFPGSIGIGPFSIDIRSWVQAGVDALGSIVGWIIGDVIRPMINLILAPAMAAINMFISLDNAIQSAASSFLWLVDQGIPEMVSGIERDIAVTAGNIVGLLGRVIVNIDANINGVSRGLTTLIGRVMVNLEASIADALNTATSYADHLGLQLFRDIVSVRDGLTGLVATVQADLAKYAATLAGDALREAEAYATTAVAHAAGVLSTDVGKAVDAVAPGLIEDLGSLAGTLATDFPDVGALVRSIDITDVGSIAGSIAGTMAITDALVKLARDCTVPNCRNLSGLGRDLHALLSLVGDASFLALILEMVHDPSGAASDIESLFGGLASDTITVTRDMIGV